MISPFAPQAPQPQQPTANNQLQLLAAALMQPEQVDQKGGYSPLQGITKMLNGYLSGNLMAQKQTPDMNNPVSQALGLGSMLGSTGPTNFNADLLSGMNQGANVPTLFGFDQ